MPNYEFDQKLENEKKLTIIVMCYIGNEFDWFSQELSQLVQLINLINL